MPDIFDDARREIKPLLAGAANLDEALQGTVNILQTLLPAYTWVGIYLVEGPDLVLRAWQGPEATEHVRIPIGQGVCGWAADKGETVVVADVSLDERYLMCFSTTRSEVVVPIVKDGKVYGEIDVDGEEIGAFGEEDARFLEALAADLASFFP